MFHKSYINDFVMKKYNGTKGYLELLKEYVRNIIYMGVEDIFLHGCKVSYLQWCGRYILHGCKEYFSYTCERHFLISGLGYF